MSAILAIVGFVVGGAVGWFGRIFMGDAVAEFRRMRGDGYTAFLSSVGLDPNIDGGPDLREAKRQQLRDAKSRLVEASRLLQTFYANNHWLSRILSWLGYDIPGAASVLQTFSEYVDQPNTNANGYFTQYKQALKFPGAGPKPPAGQW